MVSPCKYRARTTSWPANTTVRCGLPKLNTEENYDAVTRYGIQSIPTLVIFRGGREVSRLVGFAPKPQLKRQIDRALGVTTA